MYYMSLSTHKVIVQVVLFAFVFSLLIRVMFLEFSLLVLFVCTLVCLRFVCVHAFALLSVEWIAKCSWAFVHLMVFGMLLARGSVAGTW